MPVQGSVGQIHEVEPRGGELPPPGSSPQDRLHCSVKELYLLDHYNEAQVIRVQRIASQASKSNLDRQDVPLDPGSQNSLHCNTSHKEKARPQAPCLACLGPRRPKRRTEAHSESRKRDPTSLLLPIRWWICVVEQCKAMQDCRIHGPYQAEKPRKASAPLLGMIEPERSQVEGWKQGSPGFWRQV